MLWASYKRGYRSGGFNLRHLNPEFTPAYDEEVADAFEIGFKADFTETLRLNTSMFHQIYDDMQVVRLLEDQSQQTVNAAKASVTGIDVELNWLITENFSMNANLGLLDTGYDELDDQVLDGFNDTRANTIIPGDYPPLGVSDFELPVPHETAGITLIWDIPIQNGSYFTLRGSARYEGDFWDDERVWNFDSSTDGRRRYRLHIGKRALDCISIRQEPDGRGVHHGDGGDLGWRNAAGNSRTALGGGTRVLLLRDPGKRGNLNGADTAKVSALLAHSPMCSASDRPAARTVLKW